MLRMTKVRKETHGQAGPILFYSGFPDSDYVGTQKLSSASIVRGGW